MLLFSNLAKIVSKLEEKENQNLTVRDVFVLLKDTLEWTDDYAKIFKKVSVTPKVHKLEHLIIGKDLIFTKKKTFFF